MERIINLKINREQHKVIAESHESLLHVLRHKLGLTGTKECCNEGDCGACTVIMGGRAVNACLVLAVEAEGEEILTVEGLAQGTRLHPLQEAFIEYGGFQCGFCTPGMLMSAKALLDENPNPTDEEIRQGISGNLCRCTGYVKIIQSIREAAKSMQEMKNE
ncbi:MAG: Nicotinate dehydrogenase small FeS subunit [Syntrophorhabdaceae bacterium PtaU1.Bin034]|jgi:carbon-monoxide dehydrogenase small subunit|nr:MAG: Nicotinate dehydrogenase small FeS subunit [Syntrophorhabdaceae bacterium PtaU1.Bin034]